jgi:CRP-like cAMP-binding protein
LNAIDVRLKKAAVLDNKYALSGQGASQFINDVKNAGIISHLTGEYEIEHYSKKQSLYHENKKPRYLFYLVKGKVKSFRTNDDGKEYITNLFNEGDFIGYSALIEDRNYDDSAVVLEDAEVMQIMKDDFLEMIHSNMDVAAKFIRIITRNVKEKEERLLHLAYSSLRKRVAAALTDIHGKFNTGDTNHPLEISRDDFAQYVGTATESLIRTLSDFKSEKLIEIREGKITVPDVAKLKKLLY